MSSGLVGSVVHRGRGAGCRELMTIDWDDCSEVIELEDEGKGMVALRVEEAAALMRQLRAVQDNVASLRVMIESRGTGEVCARQSHATSRAMP